MTKAVRKAIDRSKPVVTKDGALLPSLNDAVRTLQQVLRADDAKGVADKMSAMLEWARRAKNTTAIEYSIEIMMRAQARTGELLDVMSKSGERRTGKEAGPGRGKKASHGATPFTKAPTLKQLGISNRSQSSRWQKLGKMPKRELELRIRKAKNRAVALCEGEREVIAQINQERHEEKVKRRAEREVKLADKIAALPTKQFGVILADPEWKFETFSEKGKASRSAENHYPTSALEDIKARDVPSISAKDCVLFLWATVPMMPQALEVMRAWGFDYVSHVIWNKDATGTGYWFVNKHELLLVGTKGDIPAPALGSQWPSVVDAPRGKHSEKPESFHLLIESYFPHLPKIELNARVARKGWDRWGLEAPDIAA